MLDTFAERDESDAWTTELDDGTGGPTIPLEVIFEDGWLEILMEGQTAASTREIRGDVAIEDLPSYPPTRTWALLIRRPLEGDPRDDSGTTRLEVFDHRPDGQGLVRLMLRRPRAAASPS